jgi:thiamine biosynthesis lipoprotein
MSSWPAMRSFPALGTTAVVVVTDDRALAGAVDALEAEIAAVDAACSRFRPDSELVALNASGGRPTRVSPTLGDALDVALRAARATGGLVDPTVGQAMRVLGYDRSFDELPASGPAPRLRIGRVPGWQAVWFDRQTRLVMVPPPVQLDLGATAKSWCADRAAARAAATAPGVGVLVSLGGDVAVAGPPPADGWSIRLADRHDEPDDVDGPRVLIRGGGLATSSTVRRRWRRGGEDLHHVVDPRTGRPTAPCWRTASVAAASCAGANTASTAALVLGPAAPAWLEARQLPARLVAEDGEVVPVGAWPDGEPSGRVPRPVAVW